MPREFLSELFLPELERSSLFEPDPELCRPLSCVDGARPVGDPTCALPEGELRGVSGGDVNTRGWLTTLLLLLRGNVGSTGATRTALFWLSTRGEDDLRESCWLMAGLFAGASFRAGAGVNAGCCGRSCRAFGFRRLSIAAGSVGLAGVAGTILLPVTLLRSPAPFTTGFCVG